MTQTTQHTKTPWRVGELCNGNIEIIHDNMQSGAITRALARVTARPTWISEAEANAAFIVSACNEYDELKLKAAACEALRRALEMVASYNSLEGKIASQSLGAIEAAITAAGAA